MHRVRIMLVLTALLLPGCQTARRVSVPAQPVGLPETLPTNMVTVIPAQPTDPAVANAATATPAASTRPGGPQGNFAFGLAWSPDGAWLAAGTFDGLRLYAADAVTGAISVDQPAVVFAPGVECCVDFVIGRRLLAAIEPTGAWVKTWDLATQQLLYTLDKGQQPFGMLALSPDETILAVSQADGVYLWEAESGQVIAEMPAEGIYTDLGFTADSRTLVAASSFASRVGVWDLEARQIKQTFELSKVIHFTLNPEATRLAVDYGLNGFELVAAEDGRRVGAIPEAIGAPGALAFSADSQQAAVWGYNNAQVVGCAAVWDLETGERLHEFCLGSQDKALNEHGGEWRGAAFSPDGARLALSDDGGWIVVYDLGQ